VSILDAIKKSSELKDVMILVSKRPNVERWLADEDVELDETDQSALRVLNKLSTDKLDVVKEYLKRVTEELPGYRKDDFALNDLNIEKYARTKDFISRFELSSLRENIGLNNMNPEGTITINCIPVYFSDSEIKVKDKVYPLTDGLLSVLTFPRSTAELTKRKLNTILTFLKLVASISEIIGIKY